MLIGGTFDRFDSQNRLHTHFACRRNVCYGGGDGDGDGVVRYMLMRSDSAGMDLNESLTQCQTLMMSTQTQAIRVNTPQVVKELVGEKP